MRRLKWKLLVGLTGIFIFGCSNQNSNPSASLRDPDKNLDPRWKDVRNFAQSINGVAIASNSGGKLLLELGAFDFDNPAKDGSPAQWEYPLTLAKDSQGDTGYGQFKGFYECGDSSCGFGVITIQKVSGKMAGMAQIYFVDAYLKDFSFILGKKESNSALGLTAKALKKYDRSFNLVLYRVQDGMINQTFSAIYYHPQGDKLEFPFDEVTYLISQLPSPRIEISHHQIMDSTMLHKAVSHDQFPGEVVFNNSADTLLFEFNSDVLKEVSVKLPPALAKFAPHFFTP